MPTPSPPLENRLRAALTAAITGADQLGVPALRSALAAIANAQAVDPATAPPPAVGRFAGGPFAGGRFAGGRFAEGRFAEAQFLAGGVVGLGAGEVPRRELREGEAVEILGTEIADRRSAADEFDRLDRPERAARLRAEAEALTGHLPDPRD